MSTLDARSNAAPPRSDPMLRRSANRPSQSSCTLRVGWTWSRLAAARSLGDECQGDVEIELVLAIKPERPSRESAPDIEMIAAVAEWRLLCKGREIAGAAQASRRRSLRGERLDTPGFLHLDLSDERGVFLRASLATEGRIANVVWARLPDELAIAGGCLSAPAVEFEEGDHPSSPSGSTAASANGHRSLRPASSAVDHASPTAHPS